jgi:tripartite-type tricarboxylate transporter receptor subunit TctC
VQDSDAYVRARAAEGLAMLTPRPGKMTAAIPDTVVVVRGSGSPQYMVAQWFAQIAGIKLEQVRYRGGGPAISDLIAGRPR